MRLRLRHEAAREGLVSQALGVQYWRFWSNGPMALGRGLYDPSHGLRHNASAPEGAQRVLCRGPRGQQLILGGSRWGSANCTGCRRGQGATRYYMEPSPRSTEIMVFPTFGN